MSCLPEKAETLTRCLYLLPVLRHLSALQRPNSSAGLPATLATDLGFKGGGRFQDCKAFYHQRGEKRARRGRTERRQGRGEEWKGQKEICGRA